MDNKYASCHYVVTATTVYSSVLVDVSRSRSVHAVEHNPCCPDPTILSAAECKAVHYGICSPLLKLPPFSIPPATTSTPASPGTPKGSSPLSTLSFPTDLVSSPKSAANPLIPSTPNSPVSIKNSSTSAESSGPSTSSTVTCKGNSPSPVVPKGGSPLTVPLFPVNSLSSPEGSVADLWTSSAPSSPATPKSSPNFFIPSTSPLLTPKGNSPSPISSAGHSPASTIKGCGHSVSAPLNSIAVVATPPQIASKVDIEILDPVELLAVDLEGKLEALVSTFVAQDKVKLAARKKAEASSPVAGKTPALTPSALDSPSIQKKKGSASPVGSLERKGKDNKRLLEEGKSPSSFTPQNDAKLETKQLGSKSTKTPKKKALDSLVFKNDVKSGHNYHTDNQFKPESKEQLKEQSKFPNDHSVNANAAQNNVVSGQREQLANVLDTSVSQFSDIIGQNVFFNESSTISPTLAKFSSAIPSKEIHQPAIKSPTPSILSALKPSAEYQQTGVKAQITKFASKEKDVLQNSPNNSLERRLTSKSKPQESFSPPSPQNNSFQQSPLSLETLQELLKSSSVPDISSEPIQTTIFQSSRIPSVPYDGTGSLHYDPSLLSPSNKSFGPKHLESTSPSTTDIVQSLPHPKTRDTNVSSYPNLAFQDMEVDDLDTSHMQLSDALSQMYAAMQQDAPYRTKPSQEFVQSAVDYAKTRFQNVQQGNKLEESKPKPKNGHLVSEAKFKWEHLPMSNTAGHQQLWSEAIVADPDAHLPEPLREVLQRSGHRRTLSMEGLIDASPSIPHPKLTMAQKQHIRERSLSPTDRHSHVPIRPFLTKGSVAERVLLFECCPDRALERTSSGAKSKLILINTWRAGGSDVQNKTQSHHPSNKDKENIEPTSPRTSSLRRFALKSSSSTKPVHIPRFHYPDGKPRSEAEIDKHLQKVAAVFAGLNDGKASREEFGIITKACGLPLYWKLPLFLAARGDKKTAIGCDAFLDYWRRVVNTCHDEASKFVRVMSRGTRNHLLPEDFIPMMQDVIESHPGLTFLKEATEFHSRYVHTVIARIYYCVNRSWSGKLTVPELRKSNFLQVLSTLEEEEDINQITEYFSYEHFYVIYCKFWELDKDHDLYINQNDLKHHNGGALSSKIIERIFSGAVTRGPVQKEGKMSYTEFVWFLISEEDKRHPRSIEYWFRCMDLDGDGFLSMYELEYFYREQLQRLDALGIETLPFTDCLCQMLDIIKPKIPGQISLTDLKKCKMTPIFFDTFFNLEKSLDHEQRDPFASQRQEHEGEGPETSDWDRYAAEEYELLVAEEGAAEQQDELMYEEYDPEVDELSPNLDKITAGKIPVRPERGPDADDEEYDYADSDDYHY